MLKLCPRLIGAALILVTCGPLVGCAGTTFSFAELPVSEPTDNSVKSAIGHVDYTIAIYEKTKNALSDGNQYFDIPIALSAVAIGVEVIKQASVKAFGYTGLIAGTSKVAETYYAPDKRADIYEQGQKALRCVRGFAERVYRVDSLVDVYAAAAQEVKGDPNVADAMATLAGDAIGAAITINSATDSIRQKVGKAQRHAGSLPDFSALVDQLKQSAATAQQKRENAARVARAVHGKHDNYDVVQSMPALNDALTTLKNDLDTCTVQATS